MTQRQRKNSESFVGRLAEAIDAGELIASGARVIVGVSGGADSVALLHALCELNAGENRGYEIIVAHANHGLRDDAPNDAAFVQKLSQTLGVQCIVENIDVTARVAKDKQGTEHAARMLRYEFFGELATKLDAQTVALAHHADDNVETILFRILRGTGLRGASGMSASRELSGSGVKIVRPLLGIRREEIIAYCKSARLEWCEDHTNLDTTYRRNFLRCELLPLIRERLNSDTDSALLRLGTLAGQTESYLTAQAEKLLSQSISHEQTDRILIDATVFATDDPIVRSTAIRLVLERLDAPQRDITAEHIESVDKLAAANGTVVNLPSGFKAQRRGTQLIIARSS